MTNKFLVQAAAFVTLSLVLSWGFFHFTSTDGRTDAKTTDEYAEFKVDLNDPAEVSRAIDRAQLQIKKVDEKASVLRKELGKLNDRKAFLEKFIKAFAPQKVATAKPTPVTPQATSTPEDFLAQLESKLGKKLVQLNQLENLVEAQYDGEMLVQVSGGKAIIPAPLAEAFYKINEANGGLFQIKTISISSADNLNGKKDRLVEFVKAYLKHANVDIKVVETQASEGLKLSLGFGKK